MNEVYINARERVGQALHDYIVGEIHQGDTDPGIDWHDGREYDQMADKVLEALWGGASANMPLIYAQFSTGGETGLRGTQPVDVLKVEANDDGSLLVTLNYWPDAFKDIKAEVKGIDTIDEASKVLMQRVEAAKEQLLMAWLAQTGVIPSESVLVTTTDYIQGQAHQKFWVERKVPSPNFDAVKDKRMSELTDAQKDDAMELWLRNNVDWFGMGGNDAGRHIAFLLKRIDDLRAAK